MAASHIPRKATPTLKKKAVLRTFSAKRAQLHKTPDTKVPVSQTLLRPLPFFFVLFSLVLLAVGATVLFTPRALPSVPLQATQAPSCVEGTTEPCECAGVRTCQGGHFGVCNYDASCAQGDIEPCFEAGCYTGRRFCNECGRWGSCVPVSSFVS